MKLNPLFLVPFLFCSGCGREPITPTSSCKSWSYRIHVIDVEASIGEAILIEGANGKIMLIDAGYASSGRDVVAPYLKSLGITHIDFIVASHYHEDHIGGIPAVIETLGQDSIFAVYDRGGSYSGRPYEYYVEAVGAKRRTIERGDTLWFSSSAYAACIGVNGCGLESSDENARSIILHISLDGLDMLTAGDLPSSVEELITERCSDVEIYKVNHHGSGGSSSNPFLLSISPEVSIISVGVHSTLPDEATIERLVALSDVYITRDNGTVVVTYPASEANKFVINTEDGIERVYPLDDDSAK